MFYIDILVILVILAYAWGGYRLGFISQFLDLIGLILAFILAFKFYNNIGQIYLNIGVNEDFVSTLGFFTILILVQVVLFFIFKTVTKPIPDRLKLSSFNKVLGILPGIVKGFIIIALILMITIVLPLSIMVKEGLKTLPVSSFIIRSSDVYKNNIDKIFKNGNNFNRVSTITGDQEKIELDFKTNEVTVDQESEDRMLELVNSERQKVGLKPLKVDNAIRVVARNYSTEMLKNGYFSHTDINGGSPSDRLMTGNVIFITAGENIALAPSVELAQTGLMNSPKHRDNILEPNFSRVGIGVVDAGKYGKMFTQNFAN